MTHPCGLRSGLDERHPEPPPARPRRRLARHPRPDAVAPRPRPARPARQGRGVPRGGPSVLPLVRRAVPGRVPGGRPAVAVPAGRRPGAAGARTAAVADVLHRVRGLRARRRRRDRRRPHPRGAALRPQFARRLAVGAGPAPPAAHPARPVRRAGHGLRSRLPAGALTPPACVRRVRRDGGAGQGLARAGADRNPRGRTTREVWTSAAVTAAALLAVLAAVFSGPFDFLRQQSGRGVQIESLGGTVLGFARHAAGRGRPATSTARWSSSARTPARSRPARSP